jgi:hypothetical protein
VFLTAGGHAGVHGARGDILHPIKQVRRRQKRHVELRGDAAPTPTVPRYACVYTNSRAYLDRITGV